MESPNPCKILVCLVEYEYFVEEDFLETEMNGVLRNITGFPSKNGCVKH